MEPIDNRPPPNIAATTPPIKANGKLINIKKVFFILPIAINTRNKTPIKTMSSAQARQPIYTSSLNSFEKFSPFLSELNKIT